MLYSGTYYRVGKSDATLNLSEILMYQIDWDIFSTIANNIRYIEISFFFFN